MRNEKKILLHPSLNFAEDLKQICDPLKKLHISYFAHVHIDERGRCSSLGLQPEFAKLYHEKEYYRYDIHMAGFEASEQYVLWDAIEIKNETRSLEDDFRSFSLGHTLTIIKNHGKSKDYYHFAGKLGYPSINERYLRYLDLLKKFIFHFNDKVNTHKELKKAYNIKFEIPKQNSGYFVADKLSDVNVANFSQAMHVERRYIDSKNYVTRREFECLQWLSCGKTIDEIAVILSITPRTIKAHIKHIKDKFGFDNQFQLGHFYSQLKNHLFP